MNSPSNGVPESATGSQGIAPAVMSPTRPMYWSVQRELWENRSIYLAPLFVAAVVMFGFVISTMTLPRRMRAALALDPGKQQEVVNMPYNMVAGLTILTAFIVGVFYCLDALYGERRDRSILFWKSMPVSDLTTVFSKMAIPLIILPVVTFVITIATQFAMLLLSSAVRLANGQSAAPLWQLPWMEMSLMLLYHLFSVHSLYYAPIFGWLLLVSAWAKRLPFLWAFLPLAAIGIIEKIVFNTSRFGAMLASRISGGMNAEGSTMLGHFAPLEFLSRPGLWIGLAFTAAFVAGAVRLRHYRDPI